MATPKSQQIGIWIIAIVMVIGTMGSFLAMILSTQNKATDQSALQKAYTTYQLNLANQTKQLSDKYYPIFSQYSTIPTEFNADSVKTLTKNDLKIGDGEEITSKAEYSAYFIGWNPKGKIFQQSIVNNALDAPLLGGGMIQGWNEGVIGMKMGGIRELSIPSKMAYDNVARSEDIPANTPLKFIVMVIPKVPDIPKDKILIDYEQSQAATQ